MKVNLFINYYIDSNLGRQNELDVCIIANLNNTQIDRVIVQLSDNHLEALNDLTNNLEVANQLKLETIVKEERPTYNDYFKLTEAYPKDINIIANTDMIMDTPSIETLKGWDWGNSCLALSRWDFVDKNCVYNQAVHFNRIDSQDVWMVKGAFPQIKEVTFGLGIGGCDNSIAHHLSKHYQMLNPSLDIKTYHYHLSQIRHWITPQGITLEKVEPPYKLITPTTLR